MDSVHESLLTPSVEELAEDPNEMHVDFAKIEEAHEIPTDRIKKILEGGEINTFLDRADLEEVLLRRSHEGGVSYSYILAYIAFLLLIAFFGYKLYQSIKAKQKKKEDKKKLKQKKKK